jgi:hypothetical protein
LIVHKPHSATFTVKTVTVGAGRMVDSITRSVSGSAVKCHLRRLTPDEQLKVFGNYVERSAKLLTDLNAHVATTGDWVNVDSTDWAIHARVDHDQEPTTSHTVYFLIAV